MREEYFSELIKGTSCKKEKTKGKNKEESCYRTPDQVILSKSRHNEKNAISEINLNKLLSDTHYKREDVINTDTAGFDCSIDTKKMLNALFMLSFEQSEITKNKNFTGIREELVKRGYPVAEGKNMPSIFKEGEEMQEGGYIITNYTILASKMLNNQRPGGEEIKRVKESLSFLERKKFIWKPFNTALSISGIISIDVIQHECVDKPILLIHLTPALMSGIKNRYSKIPISETKQMASCKSAPRYALWDYLCYCRSKCQDPEGYFTLHKDEVFNRFAITKSLQTRPPYYKKELDDALCFFRNELKMLENYIIDKKKKTIEIKFNMSKIDKKKKLKINKTNS